MGTHDFDVITVGGGLGGAALAKVLAENGLRVLVVERERAFKDRIRGEIMLPWGVAEAQRIGIYGRLLETCAHQAPHWNTVGFPLRDLRTTTPQRLPAICFYHPAMQEAVLDSARRAGAHVLRGHSVRKVSPGRPAVATVEGDGVVREHTARMVVCADGRSSMGRSWGGFSPQRGKRRLWGAGVLFEDMPVAEDTSTLLLNPVLRQGATIFPQGGGRARGYLAYDPERVPRVSGMADAPRFIEECVRTGLPADYYAGARAIAPLASFDWSEHWVWHPYNDGVALIGDAAGATDPTWGQGLSITTRDVRLLADNLLASNDWEKAGNAYARERDEYFKNELAVEDWFFELLFGQGDEAEQRRARVMPLLVQEPERMPDHLLSGPELPCDESVRRRFFGED